jgi:magnesium chelatase subunit D
MVLAHRRREAQPPPPPPKEDQSEENQNNQEDIPPDQEEESREQPHKEQQAENPQNAGAQPEPQGQSSEESDSTPEEKMPSPQNNADQIFEIGTTFKVKPLSSNKDRIFRRGTGRRSRTRVSQKQGRYIRSCLTVTHGDIALDATLRAAAPYQKVRRNKSGNGLLVTLTPQDIRGKIREKRIGNFLFFVVDASGSMGSRGRMAASKGAVMSLLLDAYQKRDKVAMISFRRNDATVNLPPTTSVDLAGKLLAEMPVGGRTPLSAGLAKTFEQVRNVLTKDPSARPIVILITDGKSNVALGDGKPVEEAFRMAAAMALDERVRHIVVDTEESGPVTFGLARRLSAALQAQYFKIEDLKAQTLMEILKGQHP